MTDFTFSDVNGISTVGRKLEHFEVPYREKVVRLTIKYSSR